MNKTKYSFWQLINEFEIEIPMIQRDYAQGRIVDKKAITIRKEILASIQKVLSLQVEGVTSALDFDFIYGKIENSTREGMKKIVPIDGQQRLTTLFLLHWYFLFQNQDDYENSKTILNRFVYNTRNSSTEFCKELVNNPITFDPNKTISYLIKDSFWFYDSWLKDPTISGMLVMLDEIQQTFKENDQDYHRFLLSQENPAITFQFHPMEELGLDDNVYIRMNSRGRALTDFENFKARFEQFLEIHYGDEIKNKFSNLIDKEWTDFLWDLLNPNIEENSEIRIIDQPFLNLFNYISEILFYRLELISTEKNFADYIETRNWWEQIYSSNESIEYLFYFFDTLTNWKNVSQELEMFSQRVPIFEQEKNWLLCCINDKSFEWTQKVLLYTILESKKNPFITDNPEELLYRIRFLRNLLNRKRQFNWPRFNNNIRYTDIHDYLLLAQEISTLQVSFYEWLSTSPQLSTFPQNSLNYEYQKAQYITNGILEKEIIHEVEDDPFFQGSIHILTKDTHVDKLEENYRLLKAILEKEDALDILQAMLTVNSYRISVGNWSSLGFRYFFGCSNWYDLFTQGSSSIPLLDFLSKYRDTVAKGEHENPIESIKIEWLTANKDFKSWIYYFIKYREFFEIDVDYRDNVLFTFREREYNFEIEKVFTKTALGIHVNPYVNTLTKFLVKNGIIQSDVLSFYTKGNDVSYLHLENGLQFWCEEDSWGIVYEEDNEIIKDLLETLPIDEDGTYRLVENNEDDRIMVALKFIRETMNRLALQ